MKRRLIWGGVLVITLSVVFFTWFVSNFEQVEVDRYEAPGREARRNQWLALERFLAEMGRPMRISHSADELENLPENGALILNSPRRAVFSGERLEKLMDWVEAGGYLIIVPENKKTPDPILEYFDVDHGYRTKKARKPVSSDDAEVDTEEEVDEENISKTVTEIIRQSKKTTSGKLEVHIPDNPHVFLIDETFGPLKSGEIPPLWHAGLPDAGDVIQHFLYGDGNVTIISHFDGLFHNDSIGHDDHAELFWTLFETYQQEPKAGILMLDRIGIPSLWTWLYESAFYALIAGLVLLLFWLWSVVPRFGVVEEVPPPARRELKEHLAAIGRFVWETGGSDEWLKVARESFQARLALRHPGLLQMPPDVQAKALADLTERPVGLIESALHGPAKSPQSFTLAIRTLRTLEKIL